MELIVTIALSLLLIPLVVFTSGALRIAVGLLFLLFFPGYTLIAALFPRKDSLDPIERVALSFGLSIAIVPLIGLILNYTPWGIRLYPIVISIVSFIVIASAVALYRRRRLPKEQRFEPHLHVKFPQWSYQSKLDRALSVILVFSILAAIGALAYAVAAPKMGERFTEFYILGPEGLAENYPSEVVLGESAEVILGVVNQEHQDISYHIVISIAGEKSEEIGPISLAHQEKWQENVTIMPSQAGADQEVDFQLYKGEDGEPYRELHLWLNVKATP